MKEILLIADCFNGIVVGSIEDYPDVEILSFADFRGHLDTMGLDDEIYTSIMPAGTDGHYELLDEEYGIH